MNTVYLHPIEYLREHAHYPRITRKLLRLLMLFGFALLIIGGMYNTLVYINTTERDIVKQTYMQAFTAEMPDEFNDRIIDQLVHAPLF